MLLSGLMSMLQQIVESLRKCEIVLRGAWLVSMLVYINVALMVMSFAPGGKQQCHRLLTRVADKVMT